MVLVGMAVGWYFARNTRPSLLAAVGGGALVGYLMLFLVSNRGEIYLGSDFKFTEATKHYSRLGPQNEFVYGAGTILDAKIRDRYFWGRRYFVVVFVRPIPRQLWPSQYSDMSRLLEIPNLEQNLGTGGERFRETVGWSGSLGAAPGLVADMWLEFWWGSILVLGILGWVYGYGWRKAIEDRGVWLSAYVLLVSLSVYLVMQSLEAMLFRFLFLGFANYLIWRPLRRKRRRSIAGRMRMA